MQKVAVRSRSIPRRSFTPELLRSLHARADRMLSEDIEHFRLHAETNEVVHVYERTDTGAPVGFQFWRTAALDLRDCRVLIGGKLRIEPEFRGRALHLRSTVAVISRTSFATRARASTSSRWRACSASCRSPRRWRTTGSSIRPRATARAARSAAPSRRTPRRT